MTLCTNCKKHYWEHDEKDLIACNKQKDLKFLEYKLYILQSEEVRKINHGERLPFN